MVLLGLCGAAWRCHAFLRFQEAVADEAALTRQASGRHGNTGGTALHRLNILQLAGNFLADIAVFGNLLADILYSIADPRIGNKG